MSLADHSRCSQAALKLVADYWVLRVVQELHLAENGLRFSELQRSLGGASPATLSNRLRRLEERGLIEREECPGKLPVKYQLTNGGKSVLPVIRAITDFATARAG